jgi:hypothetical protein
MQAGQRGRGRIGKSKEKELTPLRNKAHMGTSRTGKMTRIKKQPKPQHSRNKKATAKAQESNSKQVRKQHKIRLEQCKQRTRAKRKNDEQAVVRGNKKSY